MCPVLGKFHAAQGAVDGVVIKVLSILAKFA